MWLQVAGGCWYVLAIQRVASCIRQQCMRTANCNLSLSCQEEVCYQFVSPSSTIGFPCVSGNLTSVVKKPMCLDSDGPFRYGIYGWALPVISSNSLAVKILYPIFWGLMTLRYFQSFRFPRLITSNCQILTLICVSRFTAHSGTILSPQATGLRLFSA